MLRVVRDLDRLLTMDEARGAGPLGALSDAAIAWSGDRVTWIGPSAEAPDSPDTTSLPGCIGLPGLVDAHTHAVWAGSRTDEWEARLASAAAPEAYQATLAQGGGIHRTVSAGRAADPSTLTALAAGRLRRLASLGSTTVEVKSGYGLTLGSELAMLKAAREAGRQVGIRILTTFLGAHVVPRERADDRERYVRDIVERQLPAVTDHADFVDVFVDEGAFTLDEGRRILKAAHELGFGLKIHAEQLTHTGAAAMAARLGARSADHLERIDGEGIAAMAAHGTVAVLLPGAMISLSLPAPPVAQLREAGVPLCVATDLNPGSSTWHDLWVCASLACMTLGLTVEEALLGITARAGQALGRSDLGRLAVDGPADIVVMEPAPGEPATPASLLQHVGGAHPRLVVAGGRITTSS